MAYTGFDPRDDIIASFTSDKDFDRDGNDEKCVSPTNDLDDQIHVPVLCVEESRLGDLPYLPLIEVTIVTAPSHVTNLGGTRYNAMLIDFNIYVQNDENITVKSFIQQMVNTIINGITVYNKNNTFSPALHVEVVDEGRIILEKVGSGIVFHRVVTVWANRYDRG